MPGCGSSSSDDEGKVKDTVTSFLAAAAKGDGKKACGYTDASGRQRIEQATGGKVTCENVIKLLGSRLPANVKTGLANAEVKKVTIKGDKATIKPGDIVSKKGDLRSFLRSDTPTTLVKHGGDWKLSGD